jgi:hypothetical protein
MTRRPVTCNTCGGGGGDPAACRSCTECDGDGWVYPPVVWNEEQSRYLSRRLAGLPTEEEQAGSDMAWEGCPNPGEDS